MKPTSSKLIWIIGVVVVIGVLVYIFVIQGSSSSSNSSTASLVSTSTGSSASIPTDATSTGSAGDQVVAILRNLSSIQLSDAVFQNPAFAMLTDLSTALPPATNPGRRNPFAPVGTDTAASSTPTALSTGAITTPPASSAKSTPSTGKASMGTGTGL